MIAYYIIVIINHIKRPRGRISERKLMEDIGYLGNVYTYQKDARKSGLILVIAALAAMAPGIIFIPSAPDGLKLISASFLLVWLAFAAAGAAQIVLHTGTISLLRSGFTVKKGKREIRYLYEDVISCSNAHFMFSGILVKTRTGGIFIGSNIIGYPRLCEELFRNVPCRGSERRDRVIFKVPFSSYFSAFFMIALDTAVIWFIASEYSAERLEPFTVIFGGGLCAFVGIIILALMLKEPYAVIFEPKGITERSVLKKKYYDAKSIGSARYGQIRLYKIRRRFNAVAMVNYIELRFCGSPSLRLTEITYRLPIVPAVKYIREVYGIMPEFRMEQTA